MQQSSVCLGMRVVGGYQIAGAWRCGKERSQMTVLVPLDWLKDSRDELVGIE